MNLLADGSGSAAPVEPIYFIARISNSGDYKMRADVIKFFCERGVSYQYFCSDVIHGDDAAKARQCGCIYGTPTDKRDADVEDCSVQTDMTWIVKKPPPRKRVRNRTKNVVPPCLTVSLPMDPPTEPLYDIKQEPQQQQQLAPSTSAVGAYDIKTEPTEHSEYGEYLEEMDEEEMNTSSHDGLLQSPRARRPTIQMKWIMTQLSTATLESYLNSFVDRMLTQPARCKFRSCYAQLAVTDAESLLAHATTHLNARTYRCPHCYLRMKDRKSVASHVRVFHMHLVPDGEEVQYLQVVAVDKRKQLLELTLDCFESSVLIPSHVEEMEEATLKTYGAGILPKLNAAQKAACQFCSGKVRINRAAFESHAVTHVDLPHFVRCLHCDEFTATNNDLLQSHTTAEHAGMKLRSRPVFYGRKTPFMSASAILRAALVECFPDAVDAIDSWLDEELNEPGTLQKRQQNRVQNEDNWKQQAHAARAVAARQEMIAARKERFKRRCPDYKEPPQPQPQSKQSKRKRVCKLCGEEVCNTVMFLRIHARTHTQVPVKRYECPLCGFQNIGLGMALCHLHKIHGNPINRKPIDHWTSEDLASVIAMMKDCFDKEDKPWGNPDRPAEVNGEEEEAADAQEDDELDGEEEEQLDDNDHHEEGRENTA